MSNFKGLTAVRRPNYTDAKGWHSFKCGNCGTSGSGHVVAAYDTDDGPIKWLLCTSCGDGSVITRNNTLYPSSKFGPSLQGLPTELAIAYDEARNCFAVNAFTACELICRKILMHVAVEKKATEGDNFENYIKYLESLGYVTPPMKGWVDLIRTHGNKSTHKLESPDKRRAESTLMFTAELLRLVYEMQHYSNQYAPQPTTTEDTLVKT